jgi:hypothetical protein
MALLSVLVSPLGWDYYVPLVAGPVIALARSTPRILYAAAGFLWPIPLIVAILPVTWWSMLSAGSLQTWSLIALWGVILAEGATLRASSWSPLPIRGTLPQVR